MADVNKYFATRRFVTAAAGADGKWGTPIICPIACTQVVIENGDGTNAQAVRTDPADGDTEKSLSGALELTIRATSSGDPVFQPGDMICRVAPGAATTPLVIVTFTR